MKQFCLILCCAGCWLLSSAQDPEYPAAPSSPAVISAVEYFIDNDPGFGNGTSVPSATVVNISNLTAAINTTGLGNGVHRLYMRSKNNDGKWSLTAIKDFIVDFDPAYGAAPTVAQHINAAEYFIDNDPGIGNATAISITSGIDINNINVPANTTGLTNGVHRIYLRTRNTDGKWSLTNHKDFIIDYDAPYTVQPSPVQNIVAAEYFIDDDPGFGNAGSIAVTAATDISNMNYQANVAGLSNGVHRIYTRTKSSDGRWTLTGVNAFTVDEDYAYPSAPGAPVNINYAEYFFDEDPGFGNGNTIAITPGTDLGNINFSANTASLAEGAHTLYIRSKNNWSITNFVSFIKGQVLPLRFLHISAAASDNNVLVNWSTGDEVNTSHFIIEYSVDGISFTAAGNVAASNSNGTHHYDFNHINVPTGLIYYRIKQVDHDGRYSYSNTARVNIEASKLISIYPNPASEEIRLQHIMAADVRTIEILSTDGKILMQYSQPPILKWSIKHLPSAIYRLRIVKTDYSVHTLSFIRQ